MRLTDVITAFDNQKDNAVPFEQKSNWIKKIEKEIREYASLYTGGKADLDFLTEENPLLFLDEFENEIYICFLNSMTDAMNQEFELYAASSAFFNNEMQKWQRKYRREHIPQNSATIKI